MAYENIIIVIIVAVVIIFGAKKIPDLARSLGRAQSEYAKGKREGHQELETANKQDLPADRSKLEEIALKLGIENPRSLADDDLKDAIAQHLRK